MHTSSKVVARQSRAQALLGLMLAIALILKTTVPYLVIASVCIWLAGEVPGIDDAWGWGLMCGVLLGFLMFKARKLENTKRASAFSWHQGHYRGISGVARAGLLLLSQFQNKPQPDSRRDLGYEKDAVRNVGLAEDSVRRQRRALGYDDPPPEA
ncbi:MAG: hypothetical protein ACTS6J_20855 [Burkholderiales bacterium]